MSRKNISDVVGIISSDISENVRISRISRNRIFCSDILSKWSKEKYPKYHELDGLAIDGKSLRSTVKSSRDKQQNMGIIVSLFSQETGLVLAAQNFESKTGSEIAVAQEIVGK
jgi:hypothetical protein